MNSNSAEPQLEDVLARLIKKAVYLIAILTALKYHKHFQDGVSSDRFRYLNVVHSKHNYPPTPTHLPAHLPT